MVQFIRYVIVGSSIYWIQVLLTVGLTEVLGMNYIHSFLISLLLGWVSSFFIHKHITFQCKNVENKRLILFLFVLLITYAGWYGLSIWLHTSFEALPYMINMIASSLPFSLFGYYMCKKHIFKDTTEIYKYI